MRFYGKYIKSFLEVLFLLTTAIIWLGPFIIIHILLSLSSTEKAIFKQERLGYKGKKFHIYKFRTMSNEKDEFGNLLSDSKRITPLGNVVRKTSLDELPGILNVLKGNMSIVGPRPFIAEYENLYTPKQFRRHDVKPGITGWAQVNGRNKLTWSEKFLLDLYYIDNQSLKLDLEILILTVVAVFRTTDVDNSSNYTMPKFDGSN